MSTSASGSATVVLKLTSAGSPVATVGVSTTVLTMSSAERRARVSPKAATERTSSAISSQAPARVSSERSNVSAPPRAL